jgi:hypothetical protein
MVASSTAVFSCESFWLPSIPAVTRNGCLVEMRKCVISFGRELLEWFAPELVQNRLGRSDQQFASIPSAFEFSEDICLWKLPVLAHLYVKDL